MFGLFGSSAPKKPSCMDLEGKTRAEVTAAVNEDEKKAFGEFEKMVQAALDAKKFEVDETHPLDDFTKLRFLIANKFDPKKALKQLTETMEWRNKVKPGEVKAQDCRVAYNQGTWVSCGKSKVGNPITKVLSSRWRPSEYDINEHTNLVCFELETAVREMKDGSYQFIVIFDMAGWSMKHTSMKMIANMISILQNYYPERLNKAFLVNTPYLFNVAWKVIKLWLDPRTAAKVFFLYGDDVKAKLTVDISEDVVETKYGGKASEYKHEPLPEESKKSTK